MTMRRLAAIGLGTGCLLFAADVAKRDEPKQKMQMSNTQRIDFPSGGTIKRAGEGQSTCFTRKTRPPRRLRSHLSAPAGDVRRTMDGLRVVP